MTAPPVGVRCPDRDRAPSSLEQLVDQRVLRHLAMFGHIAKDCGQRSDSQAVVTWNRDVVFGWFRRGRAKMEPV